MCLCLSISSVSLFAFSSTAVPSPKRQKIAEAEKPKPVPAARRKSRAAKGTMSSRPPPLPPQSGQDKPPSTTTTTTTTAAPVPRPRKKGPPPSKPVPYTQHKVHRANEITTFKSNLSVQPQIKPRPPIPAERKANVGNNRLSMKGVPSEEFFQPKKQAQGPVEYGIPTFPKPPSTMEQRPRLDTPADLPKSVTVFSPKHEPAGGPKTVAADSCTSSSLSADIGARPRLNTPQVPHDPSLVVKTPSSFSPDSAGGPVRDESSTSSTLLDSIGSRPRLDTPQVPPDPSLVARIPPLSPSPDSPGDVAAAVENPLLSSIGSRPRLDTPQVPPDPSQVAAHGVPSSFLSSEQRNGVSQPPALLGGANVHPLVNGEGGGVEYAIIEGGEEEEDEDLTPYAVVANVIAKATPLPDLPGSFPSNSMSSPPPLPSRNYEMSPSPPPPLPTRNYEMSPPPVIPPSPLQTTPTPHVATPTSQQDNESTEYSFTSHVKQTPLSPAMPKLTTPTPHVAMPTSQQDNESTEYSFTSHIKQTPLSPAMSKLTTPTLDSEYSVTTHTPIPPPSPSIGSRPPTAEIPPGGVAQGGCVVPTEEYSHLTITSPTGPPLPHTTEEYSHLESNQGCVAGGVASLEPEYEIIGTPSAAGVVVPSARPPPKPPRPSVKVLKEVESPVHDPPHGGRMVAPPRRRKPPSKPVKNTPPVPVLTPTSPSISKPTSTKPHVALPPTSPKPPVAPPTAAKTPPTSTTTTTATTAAAAEAEAEASSSSSAPPPTSARPPPSKAPKPLSSSPPTKPKPSPGPPKKPKNKPPSPALEMKASIPAAASPEVAAIRNESLSPSPSPTMILPQISPMVEVNIDQLLQRAQERRKASLFASDAPENQAKREQDEETNGDSPVVPYENQTVIDASRRQIADSLESENDSVISNSQSYENQEVAPLDAGDLLLSGGAYTVPLSPSETFTVPQHAVVGPRNYCAMDLSGTSPVFHTPCTREEGGEEGNVPLGSHTVYPDSRGYCDINVGNRGNSSNSSSTHDLAPEDGYALVPALSNGSASSLTESGGGGGGGGGAGGSGSITVTPSGSAALQDPVTGYCLIQEPSSPASSPKHPPPPPATRSPKLSTKSSSLDSPKSRTPSCSDAQEGVESPQETSAKCRKIFDATPTTSSGPAHAKPRSGSGAGGRRRAPPPPPPPGGAAKPPGPISSGLCTLPRSSGSGMRVVGGAKKPDPPRTQRPPPPAPTPFSSTPRQKSTEEVAKKPTPPSAPLMQLPPVPQEPASSPGLKQKFIGFLKKPELRASKRKKRKEQQQQQKKAGKAELTQSMQAMPPAFSMSLPRNIHTKQLSYDDQEEEDVEFEGIYSVITQAAMDDEEDVGSKAGQSGRTEEGEEEVRVMVELVLGGHPL